MRPFHDLILLNFDYSEQRPEKLKIRDSHGSENGLNSPVLWILSA